MNDIKNTNDLNIIEKNGEETVNKTFEKIKSPKVKAIFANIGIAIVVVLVFIGGFVSGQAHMVEASKVQVLEASLNATKNKPTNVNSADFTLFWKVWGILNEKFVRTNTSSSTTEQDRIYGAIEGMVSSLNDPYTTFLPPSQATQFETQIEGSFQGVGMEMGIKNNMLTVVSALKNSPAEKAGIKSGDQIIKIGDKDALNMTVDQAVKVIRGPKGTSVSFDILRDGASAPIKITVVRDVIIIPTLDTKYNQSTGIFTISLYNFSSDSATAFRNALKEFVNSKSNKLILDLRGNPGGFLDSAVDMASWFLPPGATIVREDYGKNRQEIVEKSLGYNIFSNNLKMVILVDGGSASASEIVAGALSEQGRAKLVGTKTFGKGSVQEYIKVTPETALKVTVARWLTPKGKSISAEGLTPDYIVPITADDVKAGKDPQMDKAIEIVNQL